MPKFKVKINSELAAEYIEVEVNAIGPKEAMVVAQKSLQYEIEEDFV